MWLLSFLKNFNEWLCSSHVGSQVLFQAEPRLLLASSTKHAAFIQSLPRRPLLRDLLLFPHLKLVLGHLDGSVKCLTWSQLRSGSHGCEVKPHIGLHAGHGAYLKKQINKNKISVRFSYFRNLVTRVLAGQGRCRWKQLATITN